MKAMMNDLNSFDWMGTANLGLSAFNAYNQYNYQQEALKGAREDRAVRNAELARKNAARDSWSSAFKNSQPV
jgi:hypothetical protein